MKKIVSTFVFALAILGNAAIAKPIEIDTPDAHIIVTRALDSWSGDESASENSLEAVEKHKAGFWLRDAKGGNIAGFPLLFGGLSDHLVVQGVNSTLKKLSFKLSQDKTNFTIEKPVILKPSELTDFIKYQGELYKNLAMSEGNPATLHNSVSARKFFGGILALGTVVVAGDKYGNLGSNAVLNSSIPGDIYQFSSSGRAALTPLDLSHVNFDASSYKSIDVRRVIQGNNERLGQIIIAYKTDKTDDIENAALIKSIVSLTGADTTVEAIQHARDEDLAKRQAIWDACVTEGKCKND